MEMRQADKKFLVRSEEARDIEVIRSEGNTLIARSGKHYIDFMMGWCVGNLGWGNKEITQTMKDYAGPDYVAPAYQYKPWVELAELLTEIAPGKMKKCLRTTGGTESVDQALQAAITYTKRHKFVSIEGCYHGNSMAAKALAEDLGDQRGSLFRCYRIKAPLDGEAAAHLGTLLKRNDVAAVILEPIVCNLGVVIPTEEFMKQLQFHCHKHSTLLIVDEVATGFGRTGRMFASEWYDLQPDILCLAKGITGGYAPMGATLVTDEVAEAMRDGEVYASTYGWHPRSVDIALANTKYLVKHWAELEGKIEETSQYFRARLSNMFSGMPAEVCVKGLAMGIEFLHDDLAETMVDLARENRLLVSGHSERIFTMFPALNLDKATAEEGLDILEECLFELKQKQAKAA